MGIFEKLKYQFENPESKAKKSHLRNLFVVAPNRKSLHKGKVKRANFTTAQFFISNFIN